MRLLHILSQRPGRSGSGVFLTALVREAARAGFEQHVIVAGPPGTSAAELAPLTDEQVSPICFPSAAAPFPLPGNSDVMPYPTTVFSRMTMPQIEQYLGFSRQVMESVRAKFRPQVVHAHHLWLMTALAREVFVDVPMLVSSHNAELRQMIKAPHLQPRVLPGVQAIDKICVLTEQSLDDTVECFGIDSSRIAVTGAGFDGDLFHFSRTPRAVLIAELRERWGIALPVDEEMRFATFVGRLSSPKGVPFLIEAATRLPADTPPFRIVLVGATGSGADGQKMDELVTAAGSRIIHVGAQSPEVVAKLLQVSTVFVLPSLFEGLPLTMLEALACGCPVIVSALPTVRSWVPRQLLDDGFIELVPALATTHADEPVVADVSRFVANLATALERRLTSPLPTDSRRRLAEKMLPQSWSAVFRRYQQIYRELLTDELITKRRSSDSFETVIHGDVA